ncbi:IS21 family transposase [Heliophilum fasciatum]|uniref:Transposase n=1 Tax=Heliophilum fasciatum TaxID=35700 RepID=A0A4R2R9F9_9FIRM|nr:IS21 family transposase [Heliophilum fasciatum]MCW2279524.1 transposase [Heliophilum fasciatum]TCP58587.1 transposase [Heliophilum fasciatum]
MDTYKHIKDLHIKERQSIRKIAKISGLSRQTIRKILYGSVEETTRYKRKTPAPSPLKDQYAPILREWLLENQNAPAKQRYTASRLYERLTEEHGFTGGESTVRRWVREIKQELNLERIEAFIPLEHDPVGNAQCDWTPATIRINGEDVNGEVFLLRFSHSRAFYVRFYPHQRQEAFLDAHEHSFAFFGGVPPRILYDNLKTAVKRVLVGRQRDEQDVFIKFRAHHGFDSDFCNPAKGNEKGGVEGLARYVKWHLFTPVPDFPSIDALNAWLEERCRLLNSRPRGKEKVSFMERFETERDALLALSSHTFDCCARKEVKVNRFCLVQFDRNQYSVPVEYTGRVVTVKGYVHEIRIYHQQTLIATHTRCYTHGQQRFEIQHYLKLLERKPRAVSQAKPVRQAKLPEPFANYHAAVRRMEPEQGDRDFVHILLLLRRYPIHRIADALTEAMRQSTLSPHDVERLADELEKTSSMIPAPKISTAPPTEKRSTPQVAPTQLNRYAQLAQGTVSA